MEFGRNLQTPSRRDLVTEFAHLIWSKVQFPKVVRKTATSIVLLTVLLAGIITPTGLCALMCERHSRLESRGHCSQPSDAMPGMAHDHSAMKHSVVKATSARLMSRSCETNCSTAERLNASSRVVPQVTVVQTGAVVLNAVAKLLVPDPAAVWILDSGPPSPPSKYTVSFRILRI